MQVTTATFIGYEHMPEKTIEVTEPMAKLAYQMQKVLPDCPQKELGMQKLLEARDCFMRAKLTKELTPLDTSGKKM